MDHEEDGFDELSSFLLVSRDSVEHARFEACETKNSNVYDKG